MAREVAVNFGHDAEEPAKKAPSEPPTEPPAVRAAAASIGGTLKLPNAVFGLVEVRRLQREMEEVEQFLQQSRLRAGGPSQMPPRTTRTMEALTVENNLNLLVAEDRDRLKQFLQSVEKAAPVVNISFTTDPSAVFMTKIVDWFRANAHPLTLVQLGLQPGITAGCILRTKNRSFDFSLRKHLAEKRGILEQLLEAQGER